MEQQDVRRLLCRPVRLRRQSRRVLAGRADGDLRRVGSGRRGLRPVRRRCDDRRSRERRRSPAPRSVGHPVRHEGVGHPVDDACARTARRCTPRCAAGGCGGIAYVGVFDQTGEPRLLPTGVRVPKRRRRPARRTSPRPASHEAGHNLGLSHDGTATSGYYSGHGSWAPIMGVGYYKAITQWSKGEYAGANQTQDDFAVMQSNGARPSPTTTPIDTAASRYLVASPTGIISTRGDVDVFSITVTQPTDDHGHRDTGGDQPRPRHRPHAGRVRRRPRREPAVWDRPQATSPPGWTRRISTTVPPGTYTVRVDGVGAGAARSTPGTRTTPASAPTPCRSRPPPADRSDYAVSTSPSTVISTVSGRRTRVRRSGPQPGLVTRMPTRCRHGFGR